MTDSNSVRGNMVDTASLGPARTHGQYRLVNLLGEGSISRVFEGIDPAAQRTVAIKLFRPEIAHSRHFSARLRAHAVGPPRIEHPNINPLLSVICDGDEIGIVYPVVSGYALDKQVHRAGPAKLPRMIPQFINILEAFEFAHSRRFFHLDIKPGNLVFPADAPAQVLDFSISRMLGISLLTAPLLGSLDYMSPEQLSGGEMDGRADVFSLGAALYHLTTGELPFTGLADRGAPRRPGLVIPSMPNRLEEIILKALAKAPDERFQTITAFKAALSNCGLGASSAVPLSAPKAIPAPSPASVRAPALTLVKPLVVKPAIRPTQTHRPPLLRAAPPPPSASSSFLGWVALAIAIAAGSAATWTVSRERSMTQAPNETKVQLAPEPALPQVITPKSALPKPIVARLGLPSVQTKHEPLATTKRSPVFIRPRTKSRPQGPVELAMIPLPSIAEPLTVPRDSLAVPITVPAIPPPSQPVDARSQGASPFQTKPGPQPPVRVTSTAQEARRLGGKAPEYPTLARGQGIYGTVRVRITVSPEGKVSAIVPLSGHVFLRRAAEEAIKTWTYSPTVVEGKAVPVIADVNVVFKGPGKP